MNREEDGHCYFFKHQVLFPSNKLTIRLWSYSQLLPSKVDGGKCGWCSPPFWIAWLIDHPIGKLLLLIVIQSGWRQVDEAFSFIFSYFVTWCCHLQNLVVIFSFSKHLPSPKQVVVGMYLFHFVFSRRKNGATPLVYIFCSKEEHHSFFLQVLFFVLQKKRTRLPFFNRKESSSSFFL